MRPKSVGLVKPPKKVLPNDFAFFSVCHERKLAFTFDDAISRWFSKVDIEKQVHDIEMEGLSIRARRLEG